MASTANWRERSRGRCLPTSPSRRARRRGASWRNSSFRKRTIRSRPNAGHSCRSVERDGRLALGSAEAEIDARALSTSTLSPEVVERMDTGELLEGFAFDDAPAFEQWLALERRRVASAARDALRWAA